jgi:hypothetical protein
MYASGSNIARFPAGGALHSFRLRDAADAGIARALPAAGTPSADHNRAGRHAVLGLASAGAGRLGVLGDSGCLDSSHQRGDCLALLGRLLAFVAGGDATDAELFAPGALLEAPYTIVGGLPAVKTAAAKAGGKDGKDASPPPPPSPAGDELPARPTDLPPAEALPFSAVTDRGAAPPVCEPSAGLAFEAPGWPVRAGRGAPPPPPPPPPIAVETEEAGGGVEEEEEKEAPLPTPTGGSERTTSAAAAEARPSPPSSSGLAGTARSVADRARPHAGALAAAAVLAAVLAAGAALRRRGGGAYAAVNGGAAAAAAAVDVEMAARPAGGGGGSVRSTPQRPTATHND